MVDNAREMLVEEFESKDRLNHLRDAVGYRVLGALLGGCLSLNLIVVRALRVGVRLGEGDIAFARPCARNPRIAIRN